METRQLRFWLPAFGLARAVPGCGRKEERIKNDSVAAFQARLKTLLAK